MVESKVKWLKRLNGFTSQRKTSEQSNKSKREREGKWTRNSSRLGGKEPLLRSAACVWREFGLCITSPCSHTRSDYQHIGSQNHPPALPAKSSAPDSDHPESPGIWVTCLARTYPHWHVRVSTCAMFHTQPGASSSHLCCATSLGSTVFGELMLFLSNQQSQLCHLLRFAMMELQIMNISYSCRTRIKKVNSTSLLQDLLQPKMEGRSAELTWEVKGTWASPALLKSLPTVSWNGLFFYMWFCMFLIEFTHTLTEAMMKVTCKEYLVVAKSWIIND